MNKLIGTQNDCAFRKWKYRVFKSISMLFDRVQNKNTQPEILKNNDDNNNDNNNNNNNNNIYIIDSK